MKKTSFVIACVAAAGLGLGAANAATDSFSASNARLKGEQLTLNVMSPEAGWAVIHTVKSNGKPGDHIGHAQIKSGDNDNVKITLDQPVKKGAQLIVMLHRDLGKKDVFQFSGTDKTDKPAMKNGQIVETKINPQS